MLADANRGTAPPELAVLVALCCLVLLAATAHTLPPAAEAPLTVALGRLDGLIQRARIEAVARERECRLLIDTASRRVAVYDTRGTPARSDDELLIERDLPRDVRFGAPDSAAAVTLAGLAGNPSGFEAVFAPDGSVADGAGETRLAWRDDFRRISLFPAGGTRVDRWNGAGWVEGG